MSRYSVAGVVLLVLLGLSVVWFTSRHDRDTRLTQQLQDLKAQVRRDSLARETAVAQTDSLRALQDTLARRAFHVDTVFRTSSRVLRDTITRLLSTVDTVVAHEVLRQVDTIRVQGERALTACTDALSACDRLKVQFTTERQAWATERQDLQHALSTASKLNRKWGLGFTCGGAATYHAGVVNAGPGCALGLTYRW